MSSRLHVHYQFFVVFGWFSVCFVVIFIFWNETIPRQQQNEDKHDINQMHYLPHTLYLLSIASFMFLFSFLLFLPWSDCMPFSPIRSFVRSKWEKKEKYMQESNVDRDLLACAFQKFSLEISLNEFESYFIFFSWAFSYIYIILLYAVCCMLFVLLFVGFSDEFRQIPIHFKCNEHTI